MQRAPQQYTSWPGAPADTALSRGWKGGGGGGERQERRRGAPQPCWHCSGRLQCLRSSRQRGKVAAIKIAPRTRTALRWRRSRYTANAPAHCHSSHGPEAQLEKLHHHEDERRRSSGKQQRLRWPPAISHIFVFLFVHRPFRLFSRARL